MAGDTTTMPDRRAADDDLLKRVRRSVEEAQRAMTLRDRNPKMR
jgi:hypothetical protein